MNTLFSWVAMLIFVRPARTAAAPVAGEFRRQDYLGALTAVTVEEVR